MDFAEAKRVGSLIACLTEPKASQLDPELLKQLKMLLRSSEELVSHAQARLMDRLAASNSQVGLKQVPTLLVLPQ